MLGRDRQSTIEGAEGGRTIARALVDAGEIQKMLGLVRLELDGTLAKPATLVTLSRCQGESHAIVGQELRLDHRLPFEGHVGKGPLERAQRGAVLFRQYLLAGASQEIGASHVNHSIPSLAVSRARAAALV